MNKQEQIMNETKAAAKHLMAACEISGYEGFTTIAGTLMGVCEAYEELSWHRMVHGELTKEEDPMNPPGTKEAMERLVEVCNFFRNCRKNLPGRRN